MTRARGEREGLSRGSLLRRAVLANAAVMALAFALLVVTPVEVSAPIRLVEAGILAAGIAALFVINMVLLRRALAPLRQMAAQMDAVDLRDPNRLPVLPTASSTELESFRDAFERMLDRLADERRAGARAALLAQERERARIAAALHDEAGQTLTAVTLELERAADQGPDEQRERLSTLANQLQETLVEIRRIVRELRPEALDDLGLVNALIALTTRIARQSGIQIERDISAELPELSSDVELAIYRIAQEALTNVLRHSGTRTCSVSLGATDGTVILEVRDDGRGLQPTDDPNATGIEGMRERAMLVGGSLRIDSAPGEGTTVKLEVPL